MSDEENVQQGVAQAETVSNEAVPAIEEQEIQATSEADEAQSATGDDAQPEQAEPTKKVKPWFQKRMDDMATQKRQAEAKAAALEEQLSQFQKTGGPTINPQNFAPGVIDQQIEQRAQKILEERDFVDKCNKVYETGKAKYADFQPTMENLRQIGGVPQAMLEITANMPNGQDVLYHLGQNLEQAYDLAQLSPHMMALEMGRLSATVGKTTPKALSNAPAPIKPVNGSGTVDSEPPESNVDAWRAWDRKQRAKRNA